MKIKVGLILSIIMLAVIFTGCGKKQLTVYVVETDALYRQAVETFLPEDSQLEVVSFESYEQMEERLSAELLSGKGPDVILFNSNLGTTDPYKLVTGNSLMALDEMVAGLSSDEYFTQILNAGQMNGHQFFLPLSWNFLQAYSSQDAIENKGYSADMYSSLDAERQALAQNADYSDASWLIGHPDVLNYLMEIAGQEVVDYENGQLVIDESEVLETADFIRPVYLNSAKNKAIRDGHTNDFAWSADHFTYFIEDYPFMNNLRYYQSVFPNLINKEMYFAPFTERDSDSITAQVVQYGAINAQTQHKEDAWKLLCYILNTVPETQAFSKYVTERVYYAPVNRASYQACIDDLCSSVGPGPEKNVSPLSEENAVILQEIPSRVEKAVLPNTALGMLMQESMLPYMKEQDNFESCYGDLLQRLNLYLGE